MAVVAAGVHLAFVLAGVGEGVRFLHGQRVHVGAQADRALAGELAADDADHAGAAQAAIDLDAPFFKLGRDDVGGAELFKSQFGMRVDVAPDAGDIVVPGDDGFEQFHGENSGTKGNSTRVSSFENRINGGKHYGSSVARALSARCSQEISTEGYASLVDLLDRACQRHAARTACTAMGTDISYAQLDAHARAFAAWLQSLNLPRASR